MRTRRLLWPLLVACACSPSPEDGRALPLEPGTAPSHDALGWPASWAPILDAIHPASGRSELDVRVPDRADGEIALRSAHGPGVRILLDRALPIGAMVRDGAAVHMGALGGADVVRWRHGQGFEEALVYSRRPAEERASWRFELDRVAGVRVVGGHIELLDERGGPRIRMSAPAVLDARGRVQRADVRVTGCAYDEDPRGPWRRPVTAPGASGCDVEIAWRVDPLDYPVLVDPYWNDAKALVVPRAIHTATALGDGSVLLAGGQTALAGMITDAELFDPEDDTFSPTGFMVTARRAHAAVALADGQVLVVGGDEQIVNDVYELSEVERYDPAAGTWTALAPTNERRSHHTLTRLLDGRVLIVGSYFYGNLSLPGASQAVELCNAHGEDCEFTTPTGFFRADHSATLLAGGRVLVVGGAHYIYGASSFFVKSTEIFDPDASTWTTLPSAELTPPRIGHIVVPLQDGRLLLVGGTEASFGNAMQDEVLVLDPSLPEQDWEWIEMGSLDYPRWLHQATLLPNGKVLVAGTGAPGFGTATEKHTERIDPVARVVEPVGSLDEAYSFHTATPLADGRVLVAAATAELFGAKLDIESPCDVTEDDTCPNGYCVDGVCGSAPSPATSGSGGAGGSGGTGGAGGAGGSGGAADDAPAPPFQEETTSFLACAATSSSQGARGGWLLALVVAALRRRRRAGACS